MSVDAARLTLQGRIPLRRFSPLSRGRSALPEAASGSRPLNLDELLAPESWVAPRRSNPELRKVLGVIAAHLGETRRLLALPKAGAASGRAAAVRELKSLVPRDASRLPVDAAWELAGALKRLNLRLGDEAYIRSRLEYERSRCHAPGHWHGWDVHFDRKELEQLLAIYRNGGPRASLHAQALERLTFLYLIREEAGRDRRARGALKCLYLSRLAVMLIVLLAGLGLAVDNATGGGFWKTIVLTACAGALGSTLSGVFKVRDQLVRLDELRGFWPAMRVQPFVGACAGLIVFLVLESDAVSLGSTGPNGWAARGLLAFAAGFSEPFFLGIVQRVAVVPDSQRSRA